MIVELDNKEISFKYSLQDTDLEISERGIVGQERALKALRTGLKTNRNGYNLFISGEMGTGKLSSVRQEAESCLDEEMIKDVVYLANPSNPYFPISLCLNKGDGNKLKALLSSATIENYPKVLEEVKKQIPEASRYASLLSKSAFNENNYKVNLVLDRSLDNKRPFIVESHPNFENLFGYADKSETIPHLAIHIGSYAKASGGFLVLTAAEVLSQKGLWDAIKRHLDSTAMALSTSGVQGSLGKDERIRPEPIALPTKVILLGSEDIFDELCDKDEGFLRLFKVAPQFDYMMEANKENILGTIAYLKKINPNITKEACEEALRYSSSICESRDQLTCQLTLLGDLISEAALYSNGKITGDDIKRAIKDRAELTDLLEDRINQEIKSGELLVSASGSKVGIINGLAVMDRGAASFGTPAVISATVAPGSEGIVNIEHEAGLSGEIHDKGILILQGYLRKNYARSFPLSIYAGLCFEQNYSEVDGDSADRDYVKRLGLVELNIFHKCFLPFGILIVL